MKKFMKDTFSFFFIICLLISNLYVPKVHAKTLGELKKELADFKQEYEENKNQQELTEQEMASIRRNIDTISENIVKIGDDVVELNRQIEELNEEILTSEEEIENLLSFVQISNGESAYLEYAFGAKDFTDFIYRIAVSEQLTSYNEQLIDKYKDNIEENKKKTKELETKKKNLKKEQDNLSSELVKMSSRLDELDDLSLSIEEQIEARSSEIKIYEQRGCKDHEDIETCGLSFLPPDTTMWRPLKSGYVTSWFGSRDCSNSAVSCYHYGVDMSASGANTGRVPVYPIANGIVIKVVSLKVNSNGKYKTTCGGRKVYIKHNINGKIYVSGYLHLREVNVKENQTVTKDTQIGIVGGYPHSNYEYYDNCSTGAHLHLELSTGDFMGSYPTYYAYRSNAAMYINLPSTRYTSWNNRNTYLK